MLKQCPYFNFTMNGMKFPFINCRSRHNERKVKFMLEQGRDKYFNDFCCKEYKGCAHYKILKGEEVSAYV